MALLILVSQVKLTCLGAGENDVIHINDEGEFFLLAEQCRVEKFSEGKMFILENDLDLSDYENLFIPVMSGIFDGNGHTITGINLKDEVSDYGLFRYVSAGGTIRNLTVEGQVASGDDQENIGILAGSNAGEIMSCTSRGNINGQQSVGGITGKNEATGKIIRSRNEAQVDGNTATGGIVGDNEGMVSDCTNAGSINTSQKVLKEMEGEGSITISIPSAVAGVAADERANGTGGIAGNSSGEISYCKNEGTIGHDHLGYATGGIAGRQNGSLYSCKNEGTIYGRKDVGGIAGYFEPYEATSYDRDISQELSDQLDELSRLVDGLGDAGDRLGDHMSDNLDELSEQMKSLRNSLKNHLNDFEDMADDSRDAINRQVDAVKKTLDGVSFNVDLNQLDAHISQIEKDMAEIQSILEKIRPFLQSADEQMKDEIQNIMGQYEEQLGKLQQALEELKEYIKGQAGNDGTESGPVDPGSADSGNEGTESQESGDTEAESGDSEGTNGGNEESGKKDTESQESGSADAEGGKTDSTGTESGNNESTDEGNGESESGDVQSGEPGNTEGEQSGQQEDSAEENEPQTSAAHMEPMAFTTVKISDEDAAQVAAALKELARLSEDIKVQIKGIADILGTIPGEASKLGSSFKELGNDMSKLADTLDKELKDWADELGEMKDDLSGHGDRVSDSLDKTTDTLDDDWNAISDQLRLIKDKFGDIRATISDGFDELKSRIEDRSIYVDISELATGEPGVGKIVSCTNEGEIHSDSQAGGIVGSIMKTGASDAASLLFETESDDAEEEEKDSITRHVLAAVINCKNISEISVKNDYAGGVVGRADYGAVFSSQNYGDVISEDGNYVGGIAGKSEHGIQDSYVLCGLNGSAYVGGVAGCGEDIRNSYVCVYMDMKDYVKSSGAIVGKAEGTVENNYFVDNGYGAVDGVTRDSEAVPMDYPSMLELKEMPEEFTSFTVRFQDGEETIWEDTFSYGEEFPKENYPEITAPEGEYTYWEDKTVSPVHRNVTIHAISRAYIPSLASGDSEGHPSVLLGGEFYPDTALAVRQASGEEETKVLEKLKEQNIFPGYFVKKIYYYQISQNEPLRTQVSLRVKDDEALADSLLVMPEDLEETGMIQKAQKTGSYLSADVDISDTGYIVVLDEVDHAMMAVGVVLALLLAGMTGFIIWKKKYGKREDAAADAEEKKEKGA